MTSGSQAEWAAAPIPATAAAKKSAAAALVFFAVRLSGLGPASEEERK